MSVLDLGFGDLGSGFLISAGVWVVGFGFGVLKRSAGNRRAEMSGLIPGTRNSDPHVGRI